MNITETASRLAAFASEINQVEQLFNSEKPDGIINEAYIHNKWFTYDNVQFALKSLAEALQSDKIHSWLSRYSFSKDQKNIALILAGNIPAVGFHDILCTLLSGHQAKIKLSSEDRILIPFLLGMLEKHLPKYKNQYTFEDEIIKDFDAVIATGSNNSERYFKKYFGKVPNIIRHSRNSLAILDGTETEDELSQLQDDIFRYFGLGCRNVSQLLVPEGYDWKAFLEIINKDRSVLNHNAYANNLTYYTAYFSLMDENLLDGGTVLLRENISPASPPAVLHFHNYRNEDEVQNMILGMKDSLQCIVRKDPEHGETSFGQTQKPTIDDYADGIDTMEFLSKV